MDKCSNCNKSGHSYKECTESITSWGIILVKLENIKVTHDATDILEDDHSYKIQTKKDLETLNILMNNIKFLMIMRKHSLGYIEFLRGRYRPDNYDGINFLFQQMVESEINRIGSLEFDELWEELWNKDENKLKYMKKEYTMSKEKFNALKYKKDVDIPLSYYVENITPQYKTREWGFPKGRKIKGESGHDCALREFTEETGISPDDIVLIQTVKPIEENLIGTNGIKYRHIYYLAEIKTESNIDPIINVDNSVQRKEIADINFFNYNDTLSIIREYHIEKKTIIRKLLMYYNERLIRVNH